ncbi:MAG: sodium:solute symporter [Bacteroidales bacterium]|jgi:Na+/proline symporter|nr:sodium:solute symporter [Bacteroidales bacterium]MCI2144858.1 sodium:solute symporter [Bacteroidales bacterium]
MVTLDYVALLIYFLGLIGVSLIVSRRIKSSSDMFIASGSSSWWLSGMSTYMTIFSASTFVIWGGVAYKSGLVAVLIANLVGVACFISGKWIAGRWRKIQIKSPGEFIKIRFGNRTLNFYSIVGMIGKGVHAGVALYAVSIIMSTIISLPQGSPFADAQGHLAVSWAVILLGAVTLIYTVAGGFLAVLMTDMIQFGVLMSVALFLVPLSIHAVGGVQNFINAAPAGYFVPASNNYPWFWLILWLGLNTFQMGGDWPYVQRYLSVPTAKDAKKSNYLVAVLYLLTPILWYFPAMAYHQLDPSANPEQAYVLMSQTVLMKGILGVMLAAMISATLSCVSGTLNVFANVFTYDIYGRRHPDINDRQKIKVGRLFTLVFGLTVLLVALVVPYMGGAEKVVVTILTMIIAPLYIPSVWALFSRRIQGRHAVIIMLITYAIGLSGKFTYAHLLNPQVFEATCGFLIPIVLLSVTELILRHKGVECEGYEKIQAITHASDIVMTPDMKKGVKSYSVLAVQCLVLTFAGIAILLFSLLLFDKGAAYMSDPFVVRTMLITAIAMTACTVAFYVWKIIDRRKSAQIRQKAE